LNLAINRGFFDCGLSCGCHHQYVTPFLFLAATILYIVSGYYVWCYVLVFDCKQKRAFQTVLSGIKFAKFGNKDIRFLTLTTSLLCANSEGYVYGSLNNDFQVLKKRIVRYSPFRLFREGYISKNQMSKLYSRDSYFKNFSFEYFKVETNEGNGVLHILYRGNYLPYSFLVDNWTDIHNSWDINIKKIDLEDPKGASCYVVSQYVTSQESSYVRSSQSWRWVFRGFKSVWYQMKQFYYDNDLFIRWDDILRTRSTDYFFTQSILLDYG